MANLKLELENLGNSCTTVFSGGQNTFIAILLRPNVFFIFCPKTSVSNFRRKLCLNTVNDLLQ